MNKSIGHENEASRKKMTIYTKYLGRYHENSTLEYYLFPIWILYLGTNMSDLGRIHIDSSDITYVYS